jgi:hypothetical protein
VNIQKRASATTIYLQHLKDFPGEVMVIEVVVTEVVVIEVMLYVHSEEGRGQRHLLTASPSLSR